MHPRDRQRATTSTTTETTVVPKTNAELLDAFVKHLEGKLSQVAIRKYHGSMRDVLAYFTTPEGTEIPVATWTKQGVWEYLHFVEANYCTSFRPTAFRPGSASCRSHVWSKSLPIREATAMHCAGCALFKRAKPTGRLFALGRFYRYVTKLGIVPTNYMRDVLDEYFEENPRRKTEGGERRRNPSIEEQKRLVNETAHPQRRAFYAASAKWWFRPNEMFMLDRYASFGLTTPTNPEWVNGFTKHAHLASYEKGGDLVYLPETKGHLDKRRGNRWTVIDAELRPILDQHFAWWEKTVRRNAGGEPITTRMWLTPTGLPLDQRQMYPAFFIEDAERLGIMKPGDAQNPQRTWTAHCQRHFGEKLLEMNNVPDAWCNHFRGDALRDARGHYFRPEPEQIRAKYHEHVPMIGFRPLPRA